MERRPSRATREVSSAASEVYKRQNYETTLSPILWYASGLLLGVIAKIRVTWLWKV